MDVKSILPRGLIVSCQAAEGEPLRDSRIMGRMAYAAWQGGAVGIRASGINDIEAIKREVPLPVIGIKKAVYGGSAVYITPTWAEAEEVARSGAEIIALDATDRPRPGGITPEGLVKRIRNEYPSLLLMADISTPEEAKRAENLGFDLVSSTLAGYTASTANRPLPDIDLVSWMCASLSVPVIAEGGIWTLEQLGELMKAGAYAVVIGTAITRPREITGRFRAKLSEFLLD